MSELVRMRPKAQGGGVYSIKRPIVKHGKAHGRRISYYDLGPGEHEGWLRTRKAKKTSWDKCKVWCVLKESELYVYPSKMDSKASIRIYLPLFHVSDAKTETKKDGAFKVHNAGTCFYFRCETVEKKYEWMNFLSLATINYKVDQNLYVSNNSSESTSSGYNTSAAYSDEDEDNQSVDSRDSVVTTRRKSKRRLNKSSKMQSHIDGNKDLQELVKSIYDADLDITGTDKLKRRQTMLRKSMAGFTSKNSSYNKLMFMLKAKEALLQNLELELANIEELLKDISTEALLNFAFKYDYVETPLSQSGNQVVDLSNLNENNSNNQQEEMNSLNQHNSSNRNTLTSGQADPLPADAHLPSPSINHQPSSPRIAYNGSKHKQIVTHM